MNDIEKKSVASLIDELITTSMKCWFAQERISSNDDSVSAKAGRDAQSMNARRNALIVAIDNRLGDAGISQLKKTYT